VAVQTILINFTGIYDTEGFAPQGAEAIDCTMLEGVNCYCDKEALHQLREMLKPFGANGIHWIDSGDYHYLSLLWLEKIERPFALVLFDNHSDDQEVAFDATLLSCGSWVKEAKKLPNVKSFRHFRSWPDTGAVNTDVDIKSNSSEVNIPDGLPVYLSIDKDVLSGEYAATDWDQGQMSLEELKSAVRAIAAGHDIIGADICGELTVAKGAVETDLKTNALTNRIIQELLLNLLT